MNEDQKIEHCVSMCKKLGKDCAEYLVEHLIVDDLNIGEILNIISSAHITSMINSMKNISSNVDESLDKAVDGYINGIVNHIKTKGTVMFTDKREITSE